MLLVVAKKMGRRLRAREKKPRAPEARVNPSRREKDARVLPLARRVFDRARRRVIRRSPYAGPSPPRVPRIPETLENFRSFPRAVVLSLLRTGTAPSRYWSFLFYPPPNPNVIFAKRAFVSFTPS